jgi:hypothetical protein
MSTTHDSGIAPVVRNIIGWGTIIKKSLKKYLQSLENPDS